MPACCYPYNMSVYISSYVSWKDNVISHNGKVLLEAADPIQLYKALGMNYPKVYKMDPLCQLGITMGEVLLGHSLNEAEGLNTGIVLSSSDGCIDIDKKFLESTSTENFFPSPALFVYTLPNIVSGELCIRYKWKGENMFFMTAKPDADLLYEMISLQFSQYEMTKVIGGWLNATNDKYEGVLFVIDNNSSDSNKEFTKFNLESIL
jgi:hypothetical protein